MAHVVEMPLEDGGHVRIEVAEDEEASIEPVGRPGQAVSATVRTLREALSEVGPAIDEVVGQIRSAASQPERVSVQFGIKITGEANAVIAKAAAESNFTVTAEWHRGGQD